MTGTLLPYIIQYIRGSRKS